MNPLIWIPGLMLLLLSACGDNDGNDDTLLTGFSGVVILIIVVWLIWRALSKRKG